MRRFSKLVWDVNACSSLSPWLLQDVSEVRTGSQTKCCTGPFQKSNSRALISSILSGIYITDILQKNLPNRSSVFIFIFGVICLWWEPNIVQNVILLSSSLFSFFFLISSSSFFWFWVGVGGSATCNVNWFSLGTIEILQGKYHAQRVGCILPYQFEITLCWYPSLQKWYYFLMGWSRGEIWMEIGFFLIN